MTTNSPPIPRFQAEPGFFRSGGGGGWRGRGGRRVVWDVGGAGRGGVWWGCGGGGGGGGGRRGGGGGGGAPKEAAETTTPATVDPPWDKLPRQQQQLHAWAAAQPLLQDVEDSQREWSAEYFARWVASPQKGSLGAIPLIVPTRAEGGYGKNLDNLKTNWSARGSRHSAVLRNSRQPARSASSKPGTICTSRCLTSWFRRFEMSSPPPGVESSRVSLSAG